MESLHEMDTTEVIEAYNQSNQINIISSGQFRGNKALNFTGMAKPTTQSGHEYQDGLKEKPLAILHG